MRNLTEYYVVMTGRKTKEADSFVQRSDKVSAININVAIQTAIKTFKNDYPDLVNYVTVELVQRKLFNL